MGVVIQPNDHLCEVCYWRTNLKVFEFEREEEFTSEVVKKVLNMKSIICVLLLPLIVAGWGGGGYNRGFTGGSFTTGGGGGSSSSSGTRTASGFGGTRRR